MPPQIPRIYIVKSDILDPTDRNFALLFLEDFGTGRNRHGKIGTKLIFPISFIITIVIKVYLLIYLLTIVLK